MTQHNVNHLSILRRVSKCDRERGKSPISRTFFRSLFACSSFSFLYFFLSFCLLIILFSCTFFPRCARGHSLRMDRNRKDLLASLALSQLGYEMDGTESGAGCKRCLNASLRCSKRRLVSHFNTVSSEEPLQNFASVIFI